MVIPLKLLLHVDETLDKPSDLRYIKRRNKFHHGDLFHPIANPSKFLPSNQDEIARYNLDDIKEIDTTKALLEKMAHVHLYKTLEFIREFAEMRSLKYF